MHRNASFLLTIRRCISLTGMVLAWLAWSAGATAETAPTNSYPVLSGVGLFLSLEDGHFVIKRLMDGAPASQSNAIHPGDRLVAIESAGQKVVLKGTQLGEATSLIRGPVGTEVTLTLIPSGATDEVTVKLKREPLPIQGQMAASYADFIGHPFPELPLADGSGAAAGKLSDLQGQIVVVDVWASWCSTCYAPMTKLTELAARRTDWIGKVQCIGLNIDSEREEAAKVIGQQAWTGLTHRWSEPEAIEKLGIVSIPVLIILDRDGRVVSMGDSHALDVEAEVGALLAR